MNRRSLFLLTLSLAGSLACGPAQAAPPVVVPPASGQANVATDRTIAPLPSLAPLVKELRPAVVNIYTTQTIRGGRGLPFEGEDPGDPMERFFGGRGGRGERNPRGEKAQALGSGFLIGQGVALTNNHVIDGADDIKVKLADGREFDAKVIGRDASSDVALLQLQGDDAKTTPSVRLGDSDVTEVGDYVVAIGNPFGLSHTVTSGIVSAKERIIGAGPYDDFIQTDASINPGNSGGPLFNLRGEVVGINTAIVARGQGIGFAVPINMVKELLPQLREKGKVSRGWLGVGIQELTPELARTFHLDRNKGAIVSQVFPKSPAEKGGIENGDVLVEVNGRHIDTAAALTRAIASVPPNGTAKIKLLRDGKDRTVDVKVGERDEEKLAAGELPSGGEPGEKGAGAVGLQVAPISPEVAKRSGVGAGEGLVVTGVEESSAAELAGVQEGDVLLELQRKPVASLDAFTKVAKGVKPGDTVVYRVKRGGSPLYLAARVPK